MEIDPNNIIQLIFFSALFLMVMAVPKILLILAWFFISYKSYSSKSKPIVNAFKKQFGDAFEEARKKNEDKNVTDLLARTVSELKDPILESIASVVLILISVNYLVLGPDSSAIVVLVIIVQFLSIIAGLFSMFWMIKKLRPFIISTFEQEKQNLSDKK